MSFPALRQPNIIVQEKSKKIENEIQNVIVSLKNNKNLVVSSDAYHGILMGRNMFRCVFCRAEMELEFKFKDAHVNSQKHKKVLENYPHTEEHGENLIRKVDKISYYCTLCNVIVSNPFLIRHIGSEVHSQELQKAVTRALIYEPAK
ncbi:unnamed protein product [Diatraea saccharalis]|uniref:U1-type domain-containing protein n=1 Tax=Diatraea saccharalis TaxID=40085 RepID=A0A9N9R6Q5_9NEOP|nr:unnamed protein product [Diatraea saccharalis]